MTWEWSHTPEAYQNAEENFNNLDDATFAMVYAEWAAKDSREDYAGGFNHIKYLKGMMEAIYMIRKGYREALEWETWDKISDQATCDNGGFNAWVCPYGCHTVSFDKE